MSCASQKNLGQCVNVHLIKLFRTLCKICQQKIQILDKIWGGVLIFRFQMNRVNCEELILIHFENRIECSSATINFTIKGYEKFVLKGGPVLKKQCSFDNFKSMWVWEVYPLSMKKSRKRLVDFFTRQMDWLGSHKIYFRCNNLRAFILYCIYEHKSDAVYFVEYPN